MSDEDILYEVEDKIATITLNRPQAMNALTPDMEAALHDLFNKADADRNVRVIILTGTGSAFSAGYDQGASDTGRKKTDPTGLNIADFLEVWQRSDSKHAERWNHMWKLGKPIIAAVNGWAMGGGFWYQLAADITIASDKAVFSQPEVRHISNTTFLFTALCGWKAANRWALTGDHFDAEEAYRIGMVNEVVPHDELIARARALAARIALVPEPAVRLNKAIAMQGMQASGVNAALALEGTFGAMAHASHNEYREQLFETQRTEGTRAYLQMRDGPFQPEPMGPRSEAGRAAKKRDAE